jgi:hypothetical protein
MKKLLVLLVWLWGTIGFAETKSQFVRWTGAEDRNAEIGHVVSVLKAKTGFALKTTDFQLIEERDLAFNRFRMYAQVVAGVPVRSMSVRVWTDLVTDDTIQLEAQVENPPKWDGIRPFFTMQNVHSILDALSSGETLRLVREAVANHADDQRVFSVRWRDEWRSGDLVRVVKAKGRRGLHTVSISITRGQVLKAEYRSFPNADEMNIPAQVYPVYEEVEATHAIQARVPAVLKYVNKRVARSTDDPYAALRTRHYYEAQFDPIKGETEEGRAQGFWSMNYLKNEAAKIRASLPTVENSFANGLVLEGRYATVNIHPAALEAFKGLDFTPRNSTAFRPDWRETADAWEAVPSSAFFGKPLFSANEAMNRLARRLPNHDPVSYINDGFDDIQVYYAITQMFDSLKPMGFTDPDFSTRPFHAFLYDPDVASRDNAYYTDDTINFTTYSPSAINYARDNSTIWHELGHGVMDRLMGDLLDLADTGGLSEGIADLIAQFVVGDVTNNQPFDGAGDFRIINKTGFFLTNEVHDDGEAYGGAMNDLLTAAIKQYGRAGLTKVTDLVFEALRLCRNHPGLTAQAWFSHMLFADELGRTGVRAPGELSAMILAALAGRNFSMEGATPANFVVKMGNGELSSTGPGSRENPIKVKLPTVGKVKYVLRVQVRNGANYQFKFPVQVRVGFNSGPLQGAIHWGGEEKGPYVVTLNSQDDVVPVPLVVDRKCDFSNREDGSCVDYAYMQVWNAGETSKPQAKKRFYLRLKPVD